MESNCINNSEPSALPPRKAAAHPHASRDGTQGQLTHNAWLPAELQQHAKQQFCAPRTHQCIELHGITLMDHTMWMPGSHFLTGRNPESLWLALDFEGRALHPQQALELADALRLMAQAHIARLAHQATHKGGAA